jgi:predicted nuclease with TOPRIM domain
MLILFVFLQKRKERCMGLFDKFLVLLGARSVIKTIEKSQVEQQRRMQLAEMERLRLEEERDALLEMQEDYEDRIDELEDEIDELQDIIDEMG